YLNMSYCPLLDDQGRGAGLLCSVTEETERVINTRRLETLGDLAAGLGQAETRAQAFGVVAEVLGNNPYDLPFSLTYVFNEARIAWLASTTGLAGEHPCVAPSIDEAQRGYWQLDRVLNGEAAFILPLPENFRPR